VGPPILSIYLPFIIYYISLIYYILYIHIMPAPLSCHGSNLRTQSRLACLQVGVLHLDPPHDVCRPQPPASARHLKKGLNPNQVLISYTVRWPLPE
jgi:hypothetical protein